MMAKSEGRTENLPARLTSPVLSALLIVVALCFAANDLIAERALAGGPRAWQPLILLAVTLLVIGATWGLLRLRPSIATTAAVSALLAIVAMSGISVTVAVVKNLIAMKTFWGPWSWQTACVLGTNLLIGVCAILIWLCVKPWNVWKLSVEPVSPTTRRTNKLYWMMELLASLAVLALIYGSTGNGDPFGAFSGAFSNRPVAPGVAIFAATCWVLAMGVGFRRYLSADEHQRKVNDFAKVIGFRVFYTAAPAWWIASRAGLLPQPDVMVLWVATWAVNATGQIWRKNH
jgi:hypothetical protein